MCVLLPNVEKLRGRTSVRRGHKDGLVKGGFTTAVEEAEARGASVEEMKELLGKGRAKKGIFEGDLEEGELEIGQVASLFRETQTVDEVVKEIIEDFRNGYLKTFTQSGSPLL